MNLDDIDPTVIEARGKYATVNGELKTLMANMQHRTQQACDALRHGLQADTPEQMLQQFELANEIVGRLLDAPGAVAVLRAQKDELWPQAWGKK